MDYGPAVGSRAKDCAKDMEYACTIEIMPKNPKAFCAALSSDEVYERSSATVALAGKKVFIKICAKDITALRASVNDYLRQVRVCEAAMKVAEE